MQKLYNSGVISDSYELNNSGDYTQYSLREIKKRCRSICFFTLVTRTGFEPVNACVKGMRVNRFSNGPIWRLKQDSNL